MNDDGVHDFVVGAQAAGPAGTGRAYVISGAACVAGGALAAADALRILTPPAPAVSFGLFFVDGGDMNADGTPDVYVSDFSANRAHVFTGTDGSLLHTFSGTGGFGIGRFVGDANGDGHEELLLASWVHPAGGTQAGRAEVFSGSDFAVLQTITHDVPFAQFGFDANGIGDVNGDGRIDYLVTAANDASATGRAYLLAGEIDVIQTGDLNGDGSVNGLDLCIILANWSIPAGSPGCAGAAMCAADINDDGVVDGLDLGILLANWTG